MTKRLFRKRQDGRFLFLDEFDYDAIPGRKAFQIFDIDNATLYVFVCRRDCRRDEFLDGRILVRSREKKFIQSCELIAGRMGEAAPILFGRKALNLFLFFFRRAISI